MGTLYREIVENRNLRISRLMLKLIFAILAADMAFMLYIAQGRVENTIYVGLTVALLGVFVGLVLWARCKRRYRYGIIDRELIIERLNGHKRRVELNINLKQIVSIDRVDSEGSRADVEEEYMFTCNKRRSLAHRCVFEMEGRLYSFVFEPSLALLKKIEMYK